MFGSEFLQWLFGKILDRWRRVGLLLALTGCAHVSSRPLGNGTYEASCNGRSMTMGDCMAEASRVCHGDYESLGRETESGTALVNFQSGAVIRKTERHLQFKCAE